METGAELTTHLTLSVMVAYFIESLKKSSRIGWINQHTKGLNRVLSLVLAFATSVGITYSFDPTVGTLVIDGLTWAAITTTAWETLKQYVNQQLVYAVAIEKRTVKVEGNGG